MLVIGHRGAAGEAPENTIAGFRHAIERGVRHFELDVQMSRDEKLVVIHDNKVDRTSYSHGRVNQFSAADLAKMDARRSGPPWPRKKDAHIATLDAVLEATPATKSYQIEVKSARRSVIEHIAEQIAQRFPTRRAARRVVITSSDLKLHACLQDIAPHLSRGLVSLQPDPLETLRQHGCDYLIAGCAVCNAYLVSRARRAGIKVSVWTVNDPETIKNLYRQNVHSVITDYPSMALPLVGNLMR